MSSIILQSKKLKGVSRIITATAIGPFDTLEAADKHATNLCRTNNEYLYSVLSLVTPAAVEKGQDHGS